MLAPNANARAAPWRVDLLAPRAHPSRPPVLSLYQVVFVPLVLTVSGGAFTPRLALAAAMCVSGVGLLEAGGMGGGDGGAHSTAPRVPHACPTPDPSRPHLA